MTRRSTLTDVAHAAGVSLKTASRVLNGVDTVAEPLRDRVQAAAIQLDYRPNRAAAMMRSGRSGMIGMLMRDLSNQFYSTLAAGAADVAEAHGRLLITSSSEGSLARQAKLLDAVLAQRPEGLLITPAPGHDPLLARESISVPMVSVDERPAGVDMDSVTFDNRGGAARGVAAAADLDRRRFAIISHGHQLGTMPARIDGARTALAERGLPVADNLVIDDADSVPVARRVTEGLLDLASPPDVIFCANNVVAIGAAEVITRRQADVAIVSFDDFAFSGALTIPVVIVDHDTRSMGRAAAELLFSRIEHPERPVEHLIIPTTVRTLRRNP